jgi:hypothetical protein
MRFIIMINLLTSGRSAAAKKMNEQRNDGNDKQEMNQSSRDMEGKPRHYPDTEEDECQYEEQESLQDVSRFPAELDPRITSAYKCHRLVNALLLEAIAISCGRHHHRP